MPMLLPLIPHLFDTYSKTTYAAGGYVDGRFVAGAGTTTEFTAYIEPIEPDELVDLDEGQRSRAAVRIITRELLQTANEKLGIQADRIDLDYEEYEVVRVSRFRSQTLPHYEAIALRIDRITP